MSAIAKTIPVMLVTPAQAAKWLARHATLLAANPLANWRRMTDAHWKFLSAEMDAGRFEPAHEGIAIAADGRIVDGQHRLRAIAASGKSYHMVVRLDAPVEWAKYIDCGRPRKPYERLQLPRDNVALIATMLRAVTNDPAGAPTHRVEAVYPHFAESMGLLAAMRNWTSKKKHAPAPVRAAILLHVATQDNADLEAIERFLGADLTGLVMGGKTALVGLYKLALAPTAAAAKRGALKRGQMLFAKTWATLDRPKSPGVRIGDEAKYVASDIAPVFHKFTKRAAK